MKRIIGITGGIGSGKSVLSNMLRIMGYDVYDCDIRAKFLMNNSEELKKAIQYTFGDNVVVNGHIDKELLAKIVFNNKEKLIELNSLVHPIVRADFKDWVLRNKGRILFIETAILYESKLNLMVDEIWQVYAPEDIRIKRVMQRNSMSKESVKERINSQQYDDKEDNNKIKIIVNDGVRPIFPQMQRLLENVK